MKDIDFDELDRAVSSVLGQDKPVQTEAPTEKVVVKNPAKKTEEIQPAEKEPTVPVSSITINPRPKTTGPRPSGPSLATARRGKFMDVMHQTVQTQAPSKKPDLESAPKHGMVTLEPSKELQKASEEAKQAESKEAADTTEIVSTVEHIAEPTAILDESNALIGAEPNPVSPDLLETTPATSSEKSTENEEVEVEHDSTEKATAKPAKETANKIEDDLETLSIEDPPVEGSSLSSTTPQESPFLADTKIEKRPLGGAAETAEKEDDLAGYGLDTYDKKDVQSAPVVPVPRELEDDIVKVEAAQNEQEQGLTSSPFAANVAASAEPTDDGRVDGHPLFDTSTYHEPIAAVHHDGMPGWAKWLIGLLVCLAVGAGVGYFLFTAGL